MSARPTDRRLRAAVVAFALCPMLAGAQDAAGGTFKALDPDSLTGREYYTPDRFPGLGRSVFHPDGNLPAPVRAVLLVDAHAGDVPRHARYRVRHDLVPGAREQDPPVAQVEVIRFNLGRTVRADLQAQDPALPLAPPDAFGVGPHVAYRFRMRAVQGMEAGLVEAAVREVSDAEARTLSCLDAPCLALAPEVGPEGGWQAVPGKLPSLPVSTETPALPPAVAIVAWLFDAFGEDARQPVPGSETPRFEFSVSRNVHGQEDASAGLARNTVVFDDQIGTHWVRWNRVLGAQPEGQALLQPR